MERHPDTCPHEITRTPMRMEWRDLTMLHWRYPAETVQALLPDGLTVETFDGSAWVGLVPFQMKVDLPFLPAMKKILHFPETNVRTYVSGGSGEPGVFFWSLEASSLPAVVAARASYHSYATMFHEPWPLHHGMVRSCDDELVMAAGLPRPTGDPLVHYSPGVSVRCGWPQRA